ncbi:acyltransferase [Marispirochaeta aestuarii]|nr:acyltransferase [Marispirochaeta aestuarii]
MKNMIKKIRIIKKKILCSMYTRAAYRKAGSVGKNLKVYFPVKLTKNTFIGNDCGFNELKIFGHGKVTIGDNFHSGRDCKIITHVHNYDEGVTIPFDNTFIVRDIQIEDFVWIGSYVIILGGVTLGEGCIIQAGSVVVNDIPPMAIAGGHPAKVFKYRDTEHFTKLKNEKKFLK